MFKHQKASFTVALAATVCVLISLVLFLVSNSTVGYGILNSHVGLIASGAAVLFGASVAMAGAAETWGPAGLLQARMPMINRAISRIEIVFFI